MESLIDYGEGDKRQELSDEAVDMFSVVQKAMGDYPSQKTLGRKHEERTGEMKGEDLKRNDSK